MTAFLKKSNLTWRLKSENFTSFQVFTHNTLMLARAHFKYYTPVNHLKVADTPEQSAEQAFVISAGLSVLITSVCSVQTHICYESCQIGQGA